MQRIATLFALAFLVSCDAKAPSPTPDPGTRDPFGRAAAGGSDAPIAYGARRAFVVGVTSYPAESVSDLSGPAFDAADVAATLASRFGFEVELHLDRPSPVPGLAVSPAPLTKAELVRRLEAFRAKLTRRDAALFYFAGHGLPGKLLPGDAELPSTDPASWRNLWPVAEVAATLRAAEAHHTLVVLDCCFSGAALAEKSELRDAVTVLGPAALRVSEKENLGRVFNRRSFQVITAGAGDEAVADLSQAANAYAALPKDLEGHSPFTGVLLQALRGLTGRPDGILPASDLGHYLSHTLVNENRSFRAKQAPRYAALGGGEGDFLFLPVRPVLNPKLVSPLYMAGPEYAELRASAAEALARFVAEQPERADLVRSAVPHVARLLRDPQAGPRTAAARALADLARDPAPEFAATIGPLTALLPDAEAARALGALAPLADAPAVAAMKAYLDGLEAAWNALLAGRRPPEEARRRIESAPPASSASMADLEQRRLLLGWLDSTGSKLVAEAQRRHDKGREFLARAEQYVADLRHFEGRLAAAKALDFDGFAPNPAGGDARLWPGSDEEARAWRLLESTFDVRPLWTSPVDHPGAGNSTVAVSPDGAWIATSGPDDWLHLWNAADGRRLKSRSARHCRSLRFSPDGKRLAGVEECARAWTLPELEPIELPDFRALVLAWSPDGKRLAIAGADGQLTDWDLARGERLRRFRAADNNPRALEWLADGGLLVADVRFGLSHWPRDETKGPKRMQAGGRVDALRSEGDRVLVVGEFGARWYHPAERTLGVVIARDVVDAVVAGNGARFVARAGRLDREGADPAWSLEGAVPTRLACSADGRVLAGSLGTQLLVYDGVDGRARSGSPGPAGGVVASVFLPDGRRFVSCDNRGWIHAWDSVRGTVLWSLGPKGGSATRLAVSADGTTLYVARGARVEALAAADGKPIWIAERPRKVESLAVLADGRLAAGDAEEAAVLDPADGTPRLAFAAKAGNAIAGSPDGTLIACLNFDVTLHDAKSGRLLLRKTWPDGGSCMAFHPDGLWMAVGGGQGNLYRFNLESGDDFRVLKSHSGEITSLAIFPDGGAMATAGFEKSLVLWNLESAEPDPKVRIPLPSWTPSLAVAPDGKSMLTGSEDSRLVLWATPRTRELRILRDTGGNPGSDLYFSADGTRIATPSQGEVRVRDIESGRLLETHRPGLDRLRRVALLEGGGVAALGLEGGALLVPGRAEPVRHLDGAKEMAVSPDRKRVAFLHKGDVVGLEASGEAWKTWPRPPGTTLITLQFAGPDGVAASDDDGRLWIFGDAEPRPLRIAWRGLRNFAVDPAGRRAAGRAPGRDLQVWDLQAGTLLARLPGAEGEQFDLAFSPDGARLAAAGERGTLRIWELATNRLQVAYALSHATRVRFRPGGNELVTGGSDGLVRFWDASGRMPDLSTSLATHEFIGTELRIRTGTCATLWETPPAAAIPHLQESLGGLAARAASEDEFRAAAARAIASHGAVEAGLLLARGIEGPSGEELRYALGWELHQRGNEASDLGAWRIAIRRYDGAREAGWKIDGGVGPLVTALEARDWKTALELLPGVRLEEGRKHRFALFLTVAAEGTGAALKALPVSDPFRRALAGTDDETEFFRYLESLPDGRRWRGEALVMFAFRDRQQGRPEEAARKLKAASELLLPASLLGEVARREVAADQK